jgi:bacterioferritin-associated ferredoxin
MAGGSGKSAVPAGLGDLRDFTAENVSNFCGRCHRTWAEVLVEEDRSINNIRFQPYRSRGFENPLPRIEVRGYTTATQQIGTTGSRTLQKYSALKDGKKVRQRVASMAFCGTAEAVPFVVNCAKRLK